MPPLAMTPLDEPGVYALPVDAYHSDPCSYPSMSASDAERMLHRSARHAWHAHPRLNPDAAGDADLERMDSSKRLRMEQGSAMHAFVLQAGRAVAELPHADYKPQAARDARAAAVAEGRIPVLASHMPRLLDCGRAALEQVRAHPELRPVLEAPGRAEQTLLWRQCVGGWRSKAAIPFIWCRALADWLPDDRSLPIVDWKFTATSAAPHSYAKLVREAMPLRSAHYLRGSTAVCGSGPRPYWIVAVETSPPYGLSVHEVDAALLGEAREQWAEAAARWHACLSAGTERRHWPFWPPDVHAVEPSPWATRAWEDRKALEGIEATRSAITPEHAERIMARIGGTPLL